MTVRKLAVVALLCGLFALVVMVFGAQTLARMATRGVDEVRICTYEGTLRAFWDNWLFGTGFGTFADVFPLYRITGCNSPYETIRRGHSFFLEGLMGFGIVFAPLLALAYLHLGRTFLTGLRNRRRLRHASVAGTGAVIFATLHGLVDFSLQTPGMAAYLAAFLAATTTISLSRQRRSAEKKRLAFLLSRDAWAAARKPAGPAGTESA